MARIRRSVEVDPGVWEVLKRVAAKRRVRTSRLAGDLLQLFVRKSV